MSKRLRRVPTSGHSLAEAWQSFYLTAVDSGATPEEIARARLIFHAGAAAMYELIMKAVDPPAEDDCIVELEKLDAELEAFVVEVVSSGARES